MREFATVSLWRRERSSVVLMMLLLVVILGLLTLFEVVYGKETPPDALVAWTNRNLKVRNEIYMTR